MIKGGRDRERGREREKGEKKGERKGQMGERDREKRSGESGKDYN